LARAFEGATKLAGVLIAVGRVLFHAATNHVDDWIGKVGKRAHGDGRGAMLLDDVEWGAVVGRPSGEHGVEGDAKGVDIRAVIGITGCLFGRGKERGADKAAAHREVPTAHLPGDAEVGNLHPAFVGEEDVFRFYVAVYDAAGACFFERASDVARNAERIGRGKRAFAEAV